MGEQTERKRGGQPGNRNAMRHGRYLTIGALPKDCSTVTRLVSSFRKSLVEAICGRKGSLSATDAATVQTACRHEQGALLAQRWLRLESDKLSVAERLAVSQEIQRCSVERDKCVARLGLEGAVSAEGVLQAALQRLREKESTDDTGTQSTATL